MRVFRFSSATWATDADLEAAVEDQHQKVLAAQQMT